MYSQILQAINSPTSTILEATEPHKDLWIEDRANKKVYHYTLSNTFDEAFDHDDEEGDEESSGDKIDEMQGIDDDSGFMDGESLFTWVKAHSMVSSYLKKFSFRVLFFATSVGFFISFILLIATIVMVFFSRRYLYTSIGT